MTSTRSESPKSSFFDIVGPEIISLHVRIAQLSGANMADLFAQGRVAPDDIAQESPVSPLSARNHVVDCRQSEILMIQMTMHHISRPILASQILPIGPGRHGPALWAGPLTFRQRIQRRLCLFQILR